MDKEKTDIVVAKFGGTSVAKYPNKIKEIVEATDAKRKYIVVSAPGRKKKGDSKLTDVLFEIVAQNTPHELAIKLIIERLEAIGIPFDTAECTEIIRKHLQSKSALEDQEYMAQLVSLGELLAAHVYAPFLDAAYLDPRELFVLKAETDYCNAKLDFAATKAKIEAKLSTLTEKRYVIPGYFGLGENGNTALFSRGGSDLTGAYIAYFANALVYENYTDSPILAANPDAVKDPMQIATITFKELRDLTYSGFTILHHDVVRPLAEKNIPIEIRGTSEFPKGGTIVSETREVKESVLGVAFAAGFLPINVYMPGLHERPFALSDTINIFRDLAIPIEHVSTGIDDISVVVRKFYITSDILDKIIEIASELFGAKVDIKAYEKRDLGLLTVVGEGMKNNVGISGEIQKTLAENGVNIYAIDQSITERNIIYCIESSKSKKAIEGIYQNFIV